MPKSFTTTTKTHQYPLRNSQSILLSPKGTPDRKVPKRDTQRSSRPSSSTQSAPTLSTPSLTDPLASNSPLSLSTSPISPTQTHSSAFTSPTRYITALLAEPNLSSTPHTSVTFNSPTSYSPFTSLVDIYYPLDSFSTSPSKLQKSKSTFATCTSNSLRTTSSYDSTYPTLSSDTTTPLLSLDASDSFKSSMDYRNAPTTKQLKNKHTVWDVETFNSLWIRFNTRVHTVIQLSPTSFSPITPSVVAQLSVQSQLYNNLPEMRTEELTQIDALVDFSTLTSSVNSNNIEVDPKTSNITDFSCDNSTTSAQVKTVQFANSVTIFDIPTTQSSTSPSSQPEIILSQIKPYVQEINIIKGNDKSASVESTNMTSQSKTLTQEEDIAAAIIHNDDSIETFVHDFLQYNSNNINPSVYYINPPTPEYIRSEIQEATSQLTLIANKISSLLAQYNEPDRTSNSKKKIAKQLYLQIYLFSDLINTVVFEDPQIHHSHFLYPSAHFQELFDIICQPVVSHIICHHFLPDECQILKTLSFIDIDLWIQAVLTYDKLYETQNQINEYYLYFFRTLLEYQICTFLVIAPSNTKLQDLHSFCTSRILDLWHFIRGAFDLIESVTKLRANVVPLRDFITTS